MANKKEYEIAIKIAGEIEQSFKNSMNMTQSELKKIARHAAASSSNVQASFSNGFNSVSGGFNQLSSAAKTAFDITAKAATVAATAIAVISAASINAGISFESAFAGVKKTTDATSAEYEVLRQGILDMTSEMPATANEIAAVAEAAGQLGIEKESLLEFSKVMIDLGESTNLSSEEAASALAKFANITKMSADNYDELGSTIVALGNNFATTEADIVNMATNMAASGELAGLTEAQIMALSTSMSSVGIEAEAGGSSMSKLLKMIQVAVETGSESLVDFSSVAGMTNDEFSKLFGEDAVSALSSFIGGLNDVDRNGRSATVVLDDMGLTEVRLSNTILSLANANGVMSDAIDTANDAWKKNTALSEEAAKRYETTESKIEILKNGFTGLGIQIYDDLQEPLQDSISWMSDLISITKTKLSESNLIGNIISYIKKNLPTAIRNIRNFTKSFLEFMDPFLEIGKWLIKNPDVVVSTLAGIGSVIVAYKLATKVMSVTKSFKALAAVLTNPFALAITAVGLAIGGAVGLAMYIKRANNELKKQNLAEHFGDISLSLEDLKEVAEYIVKNDSINKLSESMSAFDDLEIIKNNIENTTAALDKANWKVSIGMQLSEDDKEEYLSDISSFIENTQAALLQKQYAMSLNLQVFTDDDDQGKSIRESFDAFYQNNYQEITELGTKLQEAVNTAFEDGLLTIDEVKEITELQNQITEITAKLAEGQFESQLEVLDIKFSGGDLDAESFQNLQAEIQKEVDAATSKYDESLQMSISSAKVMLEEGSINQADYNSMIQEFKENYLEQVGDIEIKASSFQMDTIKEQYSEALGTAMPEFKKYIGEYLDESMSENADAWTMNSSEQWVAAMDAIVNSTELDASTKSAIKQLVDNMQPSVEQLENLKVKYEEAGKEVPKSILDGLNDAELMQALLGDEGEILNLMADHISNSDELKNFMGVLEETGNHVPEEVAKAIENNKTVLNAPITGMYDHLKTALKNTFMNSITVKLPPISFEEGATSFVTKNGKSIPGFADGDIITRPTLATFAEDGPEAAIPLDGSQRSISLWKTAGDILGMSTRESTFTGLLGSLDGGTSGKTKSETSIPGNISYSPVLNFYGNSPSKEDVLEATKLSQDRFETMMQKYIKDKGRVQFA